MSTHSQCARGARSKPSGTCSGTARTGVYRRRRPETTALYRVVQTHLETWLAERSACEPIPRYVEQDFRRYLDCGILARGFARAFCPSCGHDFLIAFSCKGRGICGSCNARRMAESAVHLVEPTGRFVLAFIKRPAPRRCAAKKTRARTPSSSTTLRSGWISDRHRLRFPICSTSDNRPGSLKFLLFHALAKNKPGTFSQCERRRELGNSGPKEWLARDAGHLL